MILPTDDDEYGSATTGLFKQDKEGREHFLQIVLPLKKIKMVNNSVKRRGAGSDGKFYEDGVHWPAGEQRQQPGQARTINASLGLNGSVEGKDRTSGKGRGTDEEYNLDMDD